MKKIVVRALYHWKGEESIVGDLVRGLKGGTPCEILLALSLELSKRSHSHFGSVIVPVPSSKVGQRDHAYILAKNISEHLNLPFWDGLEWVNKITNQKFLNKTERFVNQMRKTKKLNQNLKVILIDDLVTTGATAIAAQKAFKGLNPMEVWSLACRI